MTAVVTSPFFLLFLVTSALGCYLAHRLYVLRRTAALADKWLAVVCAVLSLALSVVTFCIRAGTYLPPHINAEAATIVSGVTGIGIALVCFKCVLLDDKEHDG